MLNNLYGYDFYFAGQDRNVLVEFPVTPAELNIKLGSNNETVNLINDGDINILKSIQLSEIEFDATFPMKKYPYSRQVRPFQEYFNIFKDFLVNKKWFRFVVVRSPKSTLQGIEMVAQQEKRRSSIADSLMYDLQGTMMAKLFDENKLRAAAEVMATYQMEPKWQTILLDSKQKKMYTQNPGYWEVREGDSIVTDGYFGYWDTNIPVSLESMEIKENAEDGDDVVISFKLKQYKAYGVKYLKTAATAKTETTSTASDIRWEVKDKKSFDQTYKIVAGDTLTIISKKFYDTEAYWEKIYNKNKDILEKTAKDMGKASSMHGNYIWPGVEIIIPALT